MSPVKFGLMGLATTLVGGVSYWFLLNVPFIRNTALPNVALVVIGMGLAVWGVIQKRGWMTITSLVLSLLVGGGLMAALFVLMRLPAPEQVATTIETIPDFTMPNQEGRGVGSADFRGRGPLLLVFYRGHW